MTSKTPAQPGLQEDGSVLRALESFLAAEPDIVFAYLFGSRARGDHGPDSGVDLAVAPPVLRHEAIRDGRVLKEDREQRVAFEVRALGEYLDTAHLRRVQNEVLLRRLVAARSSNGTG